MLSVMVFATPWQSPRQFEKTQPAPAVAVNCKVPLFGLVTIVEPAPWTTLLINEQKTPIRKKDEFRMTRTKYEYGELLRPFRVILRPASPKRPSGLLTLYLANHSAGFRISVSSSLIL